MNPATFTVAAVAFLCITAGATPPTVTVVLSWLFSDAVWFPLLQAVVLLFAIFAAARDWIGRKMAGRGNVTMLITRSDASMKLFYGTYAAINSLLVAICLSVETAKGHRVFLSLLDTVAIVYVCLFNIWFCNYLVGFAAYLTKFEKR